MQICLMDQINRQNINYYVVICFYNDSLEAQFSFLNNIPNNRGHGGLVVSETETGEFPNLSFGFLIEAQISRRF